ncbi:hypothetical protein IG631_15073 [Alternaria alternata]|nr:hypothetical protein IG631_15073 [Alternaria alternata]
MTMQTLMAAWHWPSVCKPSPDTCMAVANKKAVQTKPCAKTSTVSGDIGCAAPWAMAICVNANRVERMGNRIIVAKLAVETQGLYQDIYCQSTKGAQIKCSSPKQSARSMWYIDRFVARLAHFRECHR